MTHYCAECGRWRLLNVVTCLCAECAENWSRACRQARGDTR